MQYIYIGTERLDLPEDFSLSVERTNFLFAFDEVSCDRSTSFDVPKTAHNERLLLVAGNPTFDGTIMRQKLAAKLFDGICSWDGYLFVSAYNAKEQSYECSFIFGDLLPLADIKERGTLDEMALGDLGVCVYSSDPSNRVSASKIDLPDTYTPVAYIVVPEDEEEPLDNVTHPSLDLQFLLTKAATALQTSISFPSLAKKYRLVSGDVNGVKSAIGKMIQIDQEDLHAATQIDTAAACLNGSIWSEGFIELKRRFGTSDQTYYIRGYKAEAHVTLTFISGASYYRLIFNAQGAYSYRGVSFQDNEPISSGKVYDVPRGTVLAVVDDRNFEEVDPLTGAGFYRTFELDTRTNPSYTITAEGELEDGQWVRGSDNIPEIEFLETLRAFATLEGKVLNYNSETNTFSFDELDWTNWRRIELKKIEEVGSISRTVAEWGQDNIVGFDSADEVKYKDKVVSHYYITNVNIEDEVDLQIMPFSEGCNRFGDLATNGEDLTIGQKAYPVSEDMHNMQHVTLPTIQAYTKLAAVSTSIEIKALFSAVDFATLTDKTLIMYDNALYIWLSAEWESGVVSLTLAKIS